MLRGSLVELCWAAFLVFFFLDTFLACLVSFLGLLRALYDSLGPLLGASSASLRDLGFSLGPFWALLGLSWAALGFLLGLSWPI